MKISVGRRALPACLCAFGLVSCGKPLAPPPSERGGAAPRPVQVERAQWRPMERVVVVTGTLAAQDESTLSAKVPGRVRSLAVDVGSVVEAGDAIAQIETRDYELRLQQAAAALAQARAALGLPLAGDEDHVDPASISSVKQAKALLEEAAKNRARVTNLSQSGITSQSEFDTVEAAHAVALTRFEAALEEARTRMAALAQRRAEHEIARQHLADATVRAPYDGVIQARLAGVGQYVGAGTPLVVLVKTDPLRLRLHVPERESALVRTGQWVRLTVEGGTNQFTGRIARLSPALNEQTRMLLIEADVPGQGLLRPGLFARAQILVQEREEGLSVPIPAVLTFAGIEKVVMIREGKAVEVPITTGRRGSNWVEVISGLGPGAEVVLNPGGLRTGQPVTVTEPAGRPQTAGAPGNAGP